MKRNDRILIGLLIIVTLGGFFAVFFLQRLMVSDDAIATVYHRNTEILRISLADGTYEILDETHVYRASDHETHADVARCFTEEADKVYVCVQGELGPVVIEYDTHRVRVIEETSPQNICQLQGYTNSPAKPVTCLPNYILIRVDLPDEEYDAYS